MKRAVFFFTTSGLSVKIRTGPVIGAVDETSARVLVELDVGGLQSVTVVSANDADDVHVAEIKNTVASVPSVYVFDNLQPKTKYKVFVDGEIENGIDAGFTTRSYDQDAVRLSAFSCNHPQFDNEREQSRDLWKKMRALTENDELDMLIHMGDQVGAFLSTKLSMRFYKSRCIRTRWIGRRRRPKWRKSS